MAPTFTKEERWQLINEKYKKRLFSKSGYEVNVSLFFQNSCALVILSNSKSQRSNQLPMDKIKSCPTLLFSFRKDMHHNKEDRNVSFMRTLAIRTSQSFFWFMLCFLTLPWATSSLWAAEADFTRALVAAAMDLAASSICSSKFKLSSACCREKNRKSSVVTFNLMCGTTTKRGLLKWKWSAMLFL